MACGGKGGGASAPPPPPPAPSNLSYPNILATVNGAVSAAPSVTGTVTSYALVSPSPALPGGLLFDSSTGAITGAMTSAQAPALYTLQASNAGGTASTTFYLGANPAGGPAIAAFAAAQPTVAAGVATTLFWSQTGAVSLSIDQGVGDVSGATWARVRPAATTTYVLTASDGEGLQSWSLATVQVSGPVTYARTLAKTSLLDVALNATSLMGSNKIFLTGGYSTKTWIYDIPSGQASAGPATAVSHQEGASVTLPDGLNLLVLGGVDSSLGSVTATVERVTLGPDGNFTVRAMTPLLRARANFSATLLPDGRILVAGGQTAGTTATAAIEIYDPQGNAGQGSTTPLAATLPQPSLAHRAVYSGGKVYLIGGNSGLNTLVTQVQIVDPVAGTAVPGAAMATLAMSFGLAELGNGKYLVAGGQTIVSGSGAVTPNAYVFDPAGNGGSGSFTPAGGLNVARQSFELTRLADGTILAAGGALSSSTGGSVIGSLEIFDPSANGGAGAFTLLSATMAAARETNPAMMPDGRVLLPGGYRPGINSSIAEIFS